MKSILGPFIRLTLIFTLVSCGEDDSTPSTSSASENNSVTKIMPLGASRVQGNRPTHESFRFELWKTLIQNNLTFDFIGTQSDPGSYPTVNGQTFDTDHEGRSGWTSGEILDGLDDWLLQTDSPDIVLFSSPGGNDALQSLPYEQAVENINAIIDILQANNPNVTILIEQMAPTHSAIMIGDLATQFDQIQRDVITIAAEQSTSTSSVIIVDMNTGFSDSLLADLVHYNEEGARFIAARYYDALLDILDR